MRTPEETVATMLIEMDLSQRKFVRLRKFLKESNALCVPSYHDLLAVKKVCMPEDLLNIKPGEGIIEIPMKPLIFHHLDRMLLNFNLHLELFRLSCDSNVKLTCYVNAGADSSTANSQFQFKGDHLDHTSIFSSFATIVCIQATWKDGSKEPYNVFLNPMANSPYGIMYLRIAMEKEDGGRNNYK